MKYIVWIGVAFTVVAAWYAVWCASMQAKLVPPIWEHQINIPGLPLPDVAKYTRVYCCGSGSIAESTVADIKLHRRNIDWSVTFTEPANPDPENDDLRACAYRVYVSSAWTRSSLRRSGGWYSLGTNSPHKWADEAEYFVKEGR